MFNTVARIAGVAALGGIAVFAGYSYTQSQKADAAVVLSPEAAAKKAASDTQTPRPLSQAPSARAIENSSGTSAQISDASATVADLFSTDDTPIIDTPSEAARLAALGSGGIFADSTAGNTDTTQVVSATATDRSSAADTAPETLPPTESPTGSLAAPVTELKSGVQDLMATTSDAAVSAAGDLAQTAEQNLAAAAASMPSSNHTATDDILPTAGMAVAQDATNTAADSPRLRGMADRAGRLETDTPSVSSTAANTPSATPSGTPSGMLETAAPTATASRATMTRNPRLTDKPDSKAFITTNARKTDKPDDGAYYTSQDTGSNFDPCLKADGTPYIGPGTALNPFTAASPCLPRATANSYDIAGGENLPLATASDVTKGRGYTPPTNFFPDSRSPLFVPTGSNFRSDYTSLLGS